MGQYFIPISNLVAHCREPENIFDALILPKLVGEYLNLPHIDEVIILWFLLQRLFLLKEAPFTKNASCVVFLVVYGGF